MLLYNQSYVSKTNQIRDTGLYQSPFIFKGGYLKMIKCKNCNAMFLNERIYNMHIILCSNKSDNRKENEEKTEDISKEKIEEKKTKRTTKKKKSREDN